MHTKLSTKHKLRHFFSGTLLWRLLHFFDCTNTKKAKLDQKALRTYLVVDMKELLNTLFLGYLFVAWWGATVPWRSTFVYAVMVCRFFLLSFYTIFSMIFFRVTLSPSSTDLTASSCRPVSWSLSWPTTKLCRHWACQCYVAFVCWERSKWRGKSSF